MKKLIIALENELMENFSECGGGVPPEEIHVCEMQLGLNFSKEYMIFIEKFGGAFVGPLPIFGIKPAPFMGDELNTVLSMTERCRQEQWPGIEDLYVVSEDLSGNPIGVDPEGNVWLIDHDFGFEKVLLAKSFNEFLVKAHTDTLFDVDEG